jgi:hypothetical protein
MDEKPLVRKPLSSCMERGSSAAADRRTGNRDDRTPMELGGGVVVQYEAV